MQRRIVAREIARGWLKHCPPSSSACLDDCFSADGVASAMSRIDKANAQPVAAPGRNVDYRFLAMNLLVLEDNARCSELVCEHLRNSGYIVDPALRSEERRVGKECA